jgi:hypothetical protein
LVIGRLLLVTLRKPRSKKPSTTTPFSASLPLISLPSGPSTMASAWRALLNRNGKSNRPNSLTMPAKDVVDATSISWTPPCSADCCCSSLPELAARVFLDLDLAARLGRHQLGELLDPRAGRVVGVVQVAEADRPLLDVLRQRHSTDGEQRQHRRQLDQLGFMGVSSLQTKLMNPAPAAG